MRPAAELIDGLLQFYDGLRQLLVFLNESCALGLGFFLQALQGGLQFVDLRKLLIPDALQFRILVLEEGDLFLVLRFISVVILQLVNLFAACLEIYLQFLVLLGQPLITGLQLLDLLIATVVTLLDRHDLLHHLLPHLRLPLSQQGLLVAGIQPFVIPLRGETSTQK